MKNKIRYKRIVSFRITDAERKKLDEKVQKKGITKSDFLREKFKHILLT